MKLAKIKACICEGATKEIKKYNEVSKIKKGEYTLIYLLEMADVFTWRNYNFLE